jgi:hypothetical protein
MKMNFKNIILIVLFISFIANDSFAGFKGNLSYNASFDDNGYRMNSYQQVMVHNTNLNLKYSPENTMLNFQYNPSFSLIPQLDNLTILDNQFSIGYTYGYDEESASNLQFSGNVGVHNNSGDLELYNNYSYSLFASINHYFDEASTIRAGYRFAGLSYYNYNPISNRENLFFIGYKSFFETNTSINLEVDYGIKSYNSSGGGMGMGKGKQTTENPSQILLNAKIAQSLAEFTGISIAYSQAFNMNNGYEYLLDFNPDMIFEKEVYDDPYSYDGFETSVTLTQIIGNNLKAKLIGFYVKKRFQYTTNFDHSEEYPNRNDESSGVGLSVEKGFGKLGLILNYNFLHNKSNSEYFNYNSNSVSFSIKYNF